MLGDTASAPRARALLVALAMLLALGLRLYRLPSAFDSSDGAALAALVKATLCGGAPTSKLLTYKLGGVQPLLTAAIVWASSSLGLGASEATVLALPIAAGVLLVGLAYLLFALLGLPRAGVWAAWLLAVFPPAVMFSRHTGAPWMLELLVALFVLARAWRLVGRDEPPSGRDAAAFSLGLTVAAWVGNQALALGPALLALLALAYRQHRARSGGDRVGVLAFARRRLLSWWLLAPLLSWAGVALMAIAWRVGPLAHTLGDKPLRLGFYGAHVAGAARASVGIGALVIIGGLAGLGVAALKRRPGAAALLGLPLLIYLAPFLLLLPPGATRTRTYVTSALVLALLLGVFGARLLAEPQRRLRWARACVLVTLWLLLLGATLHAVHGHRAVPGGGASADQGSTVVPSGVHAAALWIRTHTRRRARVFTDAWGGGGLEPNVVAYYCQRPVAGLYDARWPGLPYRRFALQRDRIDVLLVRPSNRARAERTFGRRFRLRLTVTHHGRARLLLYARARGRARRVDATAGRAAFYARFGRLCGAR